MNWKKEKSKLKKLILKEKMSYESIGRLYGCTGTNIKKIAGKLGISLSPRRTINPKEKFNKGGGKRKCLNCGKTVKYPNKFCNNTCYNEYKHKEAYNDFLKHPEKYNRASYTPKIFKKDFLKEQNGCCAICGCKNHWNGKELVFIMDHINGRASDNRRENLRLICPNCDSQLPTYKSRNKNSDRYYYRYKKDRSQETGDTENPLNDES